MCVAKTWDQFNKTFTSVIYMFVQYVTIMFSDSKTMVTLVICTCKSFIKLTDINHGNPISYLSCCDLQSQGEGVLPYKRLMGMCRWMGSHFRNWSDYNRVAFSIELLEWGRKFSDFGGKWGFKMEKNQKVVVY